jgi:hypothetical protein
VFFLSLFFQLNVLSKIFDPRVLQTLLTDREHGLKEKVLLEIFPDPLGDRLDDLPGRDEVRSVKRGHRIVLPMGQNDILDLHKVWKVTFEFLGDHLFFHRIVKRHQGSFL